LIFIFSSKVSTLLTFGVRKQAKPTVLAEIIYQDNAHRLPMLAHWIGGYAGVSKTACPYSLIKQNRMHIQLDKAEQAPRSSLHTRPIMALHFLFALLEMDASSRHLYLLPPNGGVGQVPWGNFDCHRHGWDLTWDEPSQLDVCAGDTPQCIKLFKSCLLMSHPASSPPTPGQ